MKLDEGKNRLWLIRTIQKRGVLGLGIKFGYCYKFFEMQGYKLRGGVGLFRRTLTNVRKEGY